MDDPVALKHLPLRAKMHLALLPDANVLHVEHVDAIEDSLILQMLLDLLILRVDEPDEIGALVEHQWLHFNGVFGLHVLLLLLEAGEGGLVFVTNIFAGSPHNCLHTVLTCFDRHVELLAGLSAVELL